MENRSSPLATISVFWLVKTAQSSWNGMKSTKKETEVRTLTTAGPFDAHL